MAGRFDLDEIERAWAKLALGEPWPAARVFALQGGGTLTLNGDGTAVFQQNGAAGAALAAARRLAHFVPPPPSIGAKR